MTRASIHALVKEVSSYDVSAGNFASILSRSVKALMSTDIFPGSIGNCQTQQLPYLSVNQLASPTVEPGRQESLYTRNRFLLFSLAPRQSKENLIRTMEIRPAISRISDLRKLDTWTGLQRKSKHLWLIFEILRAK